MADEKKKEAGAEAKKPEGAAAAAKKPDGAKKSRKAGAGTGAVKIAADGDTKASPEKEPRLATFYKAKVVPQLMKELGLKNPMEVPRIQKIVINCAVKDAVANPKVLDNTMDDLMAITGQKPVLTRARKAIAAFKVRAGNPVGVTMTLRRARMYEFYDRLVNFALPRVRDFKGVNNKSFDGRGNYSLGIREQIIFPEINYDQVDKVRGMTITIQTSARTNEQARAVLAAMGMPFKK
ncbi:MAG: 50S ribosomal protein L5 [Bdellovibrionales bacterium]|nr:50S ribosomal protein L5 [Bdellovibrionales bacterium]